MEKIYVKVKRRDNPQSDSYWEDFEISYQPRMTIISALREIQKNPINAKGEATASVVWEASCLEEVCGSCTMRINGRVGQACAAMVDQLQQPITLEPMTKFPVIRDLVVDRSRIFKDLNKVNTWIPVDGTDHQVVSPRISEEEQTIFLELARCMSCGSCLEVCPQYHQGSSFVGAAAISQVALLNRHPIGGRSQAERLEVLMDEGGIDDCGNAQNCVKACPKEIPLTTSIAKMGREVTKHALGKILGK